MRMRSFVVLLSAALGLSACYPDYVFDLAEDPEADSGAGHDDSGIPDSSIEEGGSDGDAGKDPDGGDDADVDGGLDAGDDADAGPLPPPDPECSEGADGGASDYECVERPPTGWSGPVALYHDIASLGVPNCPALFHSAPVFEGHQQPSNDPAICSPCTCSSPTGIQCSGGEDTVWSGPGCGAGCGFNSPPGSSFPVNACLQLSVPVNGGCTPFQAMELEPPIATGIGSCTPSQQTPSLPSPWSDLARACRAPTSSKGCESGSVCAPKPKDDFLPGLCIVKIGEGDVECPEGPYSEKHLFYRDANDERSCTPCQCGSATNIGCTATLKTYSQTGCVNEDTLSGAVPGCTTFPPATQTVVDDKDVWVKWIRLETKGTGTCPPTGGQPTGSVSPERPQTICCMP